MAHVINKLSLGCPSYEHYQKVSFHLANVSIHKKLLKILNTTFSSVCSISEIIKEKQK